MQKLFHKMAFAAVALTSWVVYDRWEDWTAQAAVTAASASAKVSNVVESALPTEPPEVLKTTVYKWQDAQGRWHFGDAPPAKAKHAKKEIYSDNVNVLPRVSAEEMAFLLEREKKNAGKESPGGVANSVVNGVTQARGLQDAMNDRAAQTRQQLEALQ
jgi:hypothetical protein